MTIGRRLHEYDRALCDYAAGNLRAHLRDPRYARWFKGQLAQSALLAYLRGDDDEEPPAPLLLNEEELGRLICALDSGPFEWDREWIAHESLHRRYIETLAEVREHLSRQAAEDWSRACAGFAERLEVEDLDLGAEIEIVRDWVRRLRQYLQAMGAADLLPYPQGCQPTPTNASPTLPGAADQGFATGLPVGRVEEGHELDPVATGSDRRDRAGVVSGGSAVAAPDPPSPVRPDRPSVVTTSADATDAQEESATKGAIRQVLASVAEVRELLVTQRQVRDYYSTEQVAALLGKAHWTVREWCRLGRVIAEKKRTGRGTSAEWVIPHAELLRIEKEGLLPLPKH